MKQTLKRHYVFPEVGGQKSPWHIIKNSSYDSYDIHNDDGTCVGYIENTDGQLVLDGGGEYRNTGRIFDCSSRKGLLQAVRLAYLLTQKSK